MRHNLRMIKHCGIGKNVTNEASHEKVTPCGATASTKKSEKLWWYSLLACRG